MSKNIKPVFLRWILIISLIGVGIVFAVIADIPQQIAQVDFTRISFLIFGGFVICSIRTGKSTYDISCGKDPVVVTTANETGWFWADAFVAAGMIGTVIGFIYMLSISFGCIDVSQPQTMRVALSKMSAGMGTALYTTASGLICSLLLKLQLFNLQRGIDEKEKVL